MRRPPNTKIPYLLALIAACASIAAIGAGVSLSDGGDDEPAPAASGTRENPSTTTRPGRPILLLFHSGGFVFGDTSYIAEAVTIASRVGFQPVAIEYPLGDLPAAVRAADDEARRYGRDGREVYAYGESAGGTLAALLSEHDLVEAAATYSQVTNVTQFVNHTPDPAFYQVAIAATDRQMHDLSPAFGQAVAPVLALVPTFDSPYLNRSTLAWSKRESLVRTRRVEGGHLADGEPAVYEANAERALGWLARRADVP